MADISRQVVVKRLSGVSLDIWCCLGTTPRRVAPLSLVAGGDGLLPARQVMPYRLSHAHRPRRRITTPPTRPALFPGEVVPPSLRRRVPPHDGLPIQNVPDP